MRRIGGFGTGEGNHDFRRRAGSERTAGDGFAGPPAAFDAGAGRQGCVADVAQLDARLEAIAQIPAALQRLEGDGRWRARCRGREFQSPVTNWPTGLRFVERPGDPVTGSRSARWWEQRVFGPRPRRKRWHSRRQRGEGFAGRRGRGTEGRCRERTHGFGVPASSVPSIQQWRQKIVPARFGFSVPAKPAPTTRARSCGTRRRAGRPPRTAASANRGRRGHRTGRTRRPSTGRPSEDFRGGLGPATR